MEEMRGILSTVVEQSQCAQRDIDRFPLTSQDRVKDIEKLLVTVTSGGGLRSHDPADNVLEVPWQFGGLSKE